jgi:hypothetical protein
LKKIVLVEERLLGNLAAASLSCVWLGFHLLQTGRELHAFHFDMNQFSVLVWQRFLEGSNRG